jgi:DNA-binding NarL/FixJ family response regulator
MVSAEAAKFDDLVEQVRLTRPDLIILDCDLPGLQAEGLLRILRFISPGVRVVALGARPEMRQAALSAGADAFFSKADPPQTLVDAVKHRFGLRVSKPPVVGHTFDALGSPPEGCQECERGKDEEG